MTMLVLNCSYSTEWMECLFVQILFLPEQINRFVNQGTAVVLFGNREYPGLDPRVAQIEVDIKGGMERLMEYLVTKGHTNFAFVSSALFGEYRVHMEVPDNVIAIFLLKK